MTTFGGFSKTAVRRAPTDLNLALSATTEQLVFCRRRNRFRVNRFRDPTPSIGAHSAKCAVHRLVAISIYSSACVTSNMSQRRTSAGVIATFHSSLDFIFAQTSSSLNDYFVVQVLLLDVG